MSHLPELCSTCRKLKDGELGRFFKKTGRAHDRRWICYHCITTAKEKDIVKLNASPLELEARKALVQLRYKFKEEFQFDGSKFRYDFAIPALRLILEIDSKKWHSHPSRRARDRRKDELAKLHHYEVARVSAKRSESISFLVDQAVNRRESELGARQDY